MLAEDQYFIRQIQIYVCREGKGYVDERHLKIGDPIDSGLLNYYKVSGLETRYEIFDNNGPVFLPASRYEQFTRTSLSYLQSKISPTRRYKLELDRYKFRYYDDAEEVLESIIFFISWLKKNPNGKNKKEKDSLKKALHFMEDVHPIADWQKIKMSQVGLQVKRRSDLSPLAREIADERDLIAR